METIQRDYAPQGVKFYYIYKALAHPETNGYVTPFTLEERLLHVKEAKATLGTRFTWICDTMENEVKHALGNAPNSEFLIDPQGKIVSRRQWSRPAELRAELEDILGPIKQPTKIDDLDLPVKIPSKEIPSGILPRVNLPGRMQAMKIAPIHKSDQSPFYVKLRAEAEPSVFSGDSGKVYLGFHLDPLYRVHWNNLAPPLEFEITGPDSAGITPRKTSAPKVSAPADRDPREFLVDHSKGQSKSFNLTVRYYACDDDDTFCVPVSQSYHVYFQQDPDGGRRNVGGRGGGRRGDFMARLMERDENDDGKLSRAEIPQAMRRRFEMMDRNGDDFIDQQEIDSMGQRFGRSRGGGSRRDRRGPSRLFIMLDANEDGSLSTAEIQSASTTLQGLDLDTDGRVTTRELERSTGAGEFR